MLERFQSLLDNIRIFDNQQIQDVGVVPFLVVLLVSLVSSLFISFLYLRFYSSRPTGSQVYRSFPLLGVAITAIFICIQFSLPLSLGLLGALSIVRFRTPIKESEEIGFIMLLIAASLACATFNLVFLAIILGVALVALVGRRFAPRSLGGSTHDGSLILSLPEQEYGDKRTALLDFIDSSLPSAGIESLSKNEGEIVLTMSFRAIAPRALAEFEGELRKLVKPTTLTILYNRPGAW